MVNEYKEEYMVHIQHAMEDKYKIVQDMAKWALKKLELL
jgi:hypothetical protein